MLNGGKRFIESHSQKPRSFHLAVGLKSYSVFASFKSLTGALDYEFQDVAASASKAYALGLRQVGTALVAGIRRDLENHFDELGNDFKASFLLVVKNRVETTVVSISICAVYFVTPS